MITKVKEATTGAIQEPEVDDHAGHIHKRSVVDEHHHEEHLVEKVTPIFYLVIIIIGLLVTY